MLVTRLFNEMIRLFKSSPRRQFLNYFDAQMTAGRAAFELDQISTAENCFRKALNSVQRSHGVKHATGVGAPVADAFSRLADIHGSNGAYGLMSSVIEEVRSVEQEKGRNHPKVADLLIVLGYLYRALEGKTKGVGRSWYSSVMSSHWAKIGEDLALRAVKIRKKAFGKNHLLVADALDAVFSFPWRSDFSSRPQGSHIALKIREQALGPDHPDVITSWLLANEHSEEVREFLPKALKVRQDAFGSKHPVVAETMESYAQKLMGVSTDKEVEDLLRDALALREEVQGPWHPDLDEPLSHLYHFFDYRERSSEAEAVIERALEILIKAAAINRPDWHHEQEIFEFVVPSQGGRFDGFERISVSEGSAHLITLPTGKENSGDPQGITRTPLTLEEVLARRGKPSFFTVLDRLADAIYAQYNWLWAEEGWPRECYGFEELTDPLHHGEVPTGWMDRFLNLKRLVAKGRID